MVAGDNDPLGRQPERAREPRSGPLGRGGNQIDVCCAARVRPAQQFRKAAGEGDRRIQLNSLQRNAVPQLHDERPAGAESVDVAEAVGDRDDAGAQGEAKPAPALCPRRRHAASARGLEFARGTRQPNACDSAIGGMVVQRERALAESGSATEHPHIITPASHQTRNRAEGVERKGRDFARVARRKCETGSSLRHAPA